eukprot:CFRG6520T1
MRPCTLVMVHSNEILSASRRTAYVELIHKMGIHGLTKLICDHAPGATRNHEMKNYFSRKIAIDASMSIYQFLIAVRTQGNTLQNESGETTSHLMGMFYRTIRMIENGIKPVYVFDGKPPEMKSVELVKRTQRRDNTEKELAEAKEAGVAEDVEKYSRRLTKVTKQHNEECKQLLKLMGVPYVDAPSEAEAQCAQLVKDKKVFATATEDMDSLTFGSLILVRHLTFSEARKMPIQEFHLDKVLEELDMSMDEFIDLCILMGCDYCNTIKGIGPKRALELIKKHKNIETVLENIDSKKYPIEEGWPYKAAREFFKNPEVTGGENIEFKWTAPDEEGLIKFMCDEKDFNEDRIRSGIAKLTKAKKGSAQGRLDSFFKAAPSSKSSTLKRKAEDAKNGKASKKKVPPKKKK